MKSLVTIMILHACISVAQEKKTVTVSSFHALPAVHIRALEVVNDSTVWFAANRGMWGFTRNAGRTWHFDSLKVDTVYPQFRSMAVLNDSTVLLLSVGSPAYLLRTTNSGKTWNTVYRNNHKDIFFDSMIFSDEKNGYAIADPIEGCFQLLVTRNGGEDWQMHPCSSIPKAAEGEACFATSNSNLDVIGKNIWFVTGGKRSRVFRSDDGGETFKGHDTPLPQGEQMTGIFSFDFYNATRGVVAGGNYEKTDSSIISLAVTSDGGRTWKPVRTGGPFFGSCVRLRNADEAFVTGHDGTFRIDLRTQKLTELTDEAGKALKFHTMRLSTSGKYLWLAGAFGKIARIPVPGW